MCVPNVRCTFVSCRTKVTVLSTYMFLSNPVPRTVHRTPYSYTMCAAEFSYVQCSPYTAPPTPYICTSRLFLYACTLCARSRALFLRMFAGWPSFLGRRSSAYVGVRSFVCRSFVLLSLVRSFVVVARSFVCRSFVRLLSFVRSFVVGVRRRSSAFVRRRSVVRLSSLFVVVRSFVCRSFVRSSLVRSFVVGVRCISSDAVWRRRRLAGLRRVLCRRRCHVVLGGWSCMYVCVCCYARTCAFSHAALLLRRRPPCPSRQCAQRQHRAAKASFVCRCCSSFVGCGCCASSVWASERRRRLLSVPRCPQWVSMHLCWSWHCSFIGLRVHLVHLVNALSKFTYAQRQSSVAKDSSSFCFHSVFCISRFGDFLSCTDVSRRPHDICLRFVLTP